MTFTLKSFSYLISLFLSLQTILVRAVANRARRAGASLSALAPATDSGGRPSALAKSCAIATPFWSGERMLATARVGSAGIPFRFLCDGRAVVRLTFGAWYWQPAGGAAAAQGQKEGRGDGE